MRRRVTVGCSVTFAGLPGLSRRGDLSLLASGYSSLRQPVDPASRATATVRGASPATTPCHILYQDAHIIAVDKPPYLPVHASFGRGRKRTCTAEPADTLLDRLASQLGISARPKESTGGVGLHPLHRLDQDTSGVVLFSLDRAFATAAFRSLVVCVDLTSNVPYTCRGKCSDPPLGVVLNNQTLCDIGGWPRR